MSEFCLFVSLGLRLNSCISARPGHRENTKAHFMFIEQHRNHCRRMRLRRWTVVPDMPFYCPTRRAGLSACRTGDRNVTWHGPGPAWHRFKDFTSPKVLGLLGLLGLLALLGLLGLLRLLDSGHLHDLIEFLLVPASQVWDLKQKKEVISFQADWGSNSADFGAPAQNSWKCQMSKEIKYLRDRTDSFELNLERKSKWIESLSLNLLGSWWFFSIPFLDRFAELCRRILQVAYAAQAWLGIPRCRKTHGKCRKQGWVMVSHGESLCDRLCEPPCESLRVSLDIT